MDKDVSTKAFEEKNKAKTSKKPTKSQGGRTLKSMLKRQNEVKSARALIIKLTSLLKKNWKEDQTSTFLTTYKKEEDKDSSRANPTK